MLKKQNTDEVSIFEIGILVALILLIVVSVLIAFTQQNKIEDDQESDSVKALAAEGTNSQIEGLPSTAEQEPNPINSDGWGINTQVYATSNGWVTSVPPSMSPNPSDLVISRKERNIQKIVQIAEEYHSIHTYSLPDLFVCADMAKDIWNIVRTAGLNAKICVGSVNEDLSRESVIEQLRKINHAWVLSEVEPFKYLAIETTGGYVVWSSSVGAGQDTVNPLYYNGICFQNPKQVDQFVLWRSKMFTACMEAQNMIDFWNTNIAGRQSSNDIAEYKGKIQAKQEECSLTIQQLSTIISMAQQETAAQQPPIYGGWYDTEE